MKRIADDEPDQFQFPQLFLKIAMKFNSYLVELNHRLQSFTDNLIIQGEVLQANFKRVSEHIFIVHFKIQSELHFLETIRLKEKNKELAVLIPILAKYNKRKLSKLAKLIGVSTSRTWQTIILDYLKVEKFLAVEKLVDFFGLRKKEILDFLVQEEINEQLKIIDVQSLCVISVEAFSQYVFELNEFLKNLWLQNRKAVKFNEIEKAMKLSYSTFFFKLMLRYIDKDLMVRLHQNQVIFLKVTLSNKELEVAGSVQKLLRKNHLSIFSIDKVIQLTDLTYQQINDTFWYWLENGKIIQLDNQNFMFQEDFQKILNRLKKYKRNHDEIIDIQDFREMTNFPRKNIIILLEYLDSCRITQRFGNQRKILLGV